MNDMETILDTQTFAITATENLPMLLASFRHEKSEKPFSEQYMFRELSHQMAMRFMALEVNA